MKRQIFTSFSVMTSKPFRSYMICTVPRSGSTLLCGLLAATSHAGHPDSHFHSSSLDDWLNDYGLKQTDYASREDCLRAVFMHARAIVKSGVLGLSCGGPIWV